MPDPKKKKKQSVHPWMQKLNQWDKQFKNTEGYKNIKKGFKIIKKKKAEKKKNRYADVYKYGGYYK